MTTKTPAKLPFEKSYLVLDEEGYGVSEFSQSRDAFRAARKLETENGGKFHVAQLVVLQDKSVSDKVADIRAETLVAKAVALEKKSKRLLMEDSFSKLLAD